MARKKALALSAPTALAREVDPTGERKNLLALCGEPIEKFARPGWLEVRRIFRSRLCKELSCHHSLFVKILLDPWYILGVLGAVMMLFLGFSPLTALPALLISFLLSFPEIYLVRRLSWRWHRRELDAKRAELLKEAPANALQFLRAGLEKLQQDLLKDNLDQVGVHSILTRALLWFQNKNDELACQANAFRAEVKSLVEKPESAALNQRLEAAANNIEQLKRCVADSLGAFNAFQHAFACAHAELRKVVNCFIDAREHDQYLANRFRNLQALQPGEWDETAAEIDGSTESMLADLPPLFEKLDKLEEVAQLIQSGVNRLTLSPTHDLLKQLTAFDEVVEAAQEMLKPEPT